MTNPTTDEPVAVLLSDVTRLFWRRLEGALAAAGLAFTAAEARTLVTVAKLGGARQTAVAERMHIEPMTLVGFLDRLEARGLIERRPDPADRRAKLVAATPAALATVGEILAVAATVKAQVAAGLSADEIDVLRDLLTRIRTNLVGLADKTGACAA